MADYCKYTIRNLTNATAVKIEKGDDDYPRMLMLERVCERFLRSAILLPEGEFLGVQFSATEGSVMGCIAFSGSGTDISQEDYNWIFRGFGKTEENGTAALRELFGDERTVYRLTSVAGGPKDTDATADERRSGFYRDDTDGETATHYFRDMFNMLKQENAVVQITAGSVQAGNAQHGMILISFPGKVSLRMEALIALAFPHYAVEIIESPQDSEENFPCLPDSRFLDGMVRFLGGLVSQGVKKPGKKSDNLFGDDITDDLFDESSGIGTPHGDEGVEGDAAGDGAKGKTPEGGDDGDAGSDSEAGTGAAANGGNVGRPTSLKALNLTIRSLSVLRNAGINSVEALAAMSDEELRNVRHITDVSVEEISEKLANYLGTRKTILLPKAQKSSAEQLSEMIGLAEVKKQVERIAAFARMKKAMEQSGRSGLSVALNMEFVGNPGTAKTTVARLVTGIFYENGLLRSSEMVEVGRADLVACYTGQTADKVKSVFRKAEGKLLFIDEAYSLIDTWENSYGDEAINTIVQEMENNREHTIVIFAGYPDRMEEFFSRNHGLRSRVPFRVVFPDYSAEEMVRIVCSEVRQRGFSMTAAAKERVLELCRAEKEKPFSGNGRFCRNITENAILGYAARTFATGIKNPTPDYILGKEDFTKPEKPKKSPEKEEKKKRIIGFVA